MSEIYDKTGREIKVGDVLKVYHFTGARRKRHFMYKQPTEIVMLGKPDSQSPYLFVSHLAMKARGEKDDGYHLPLNGQHYPDYEIVQGLEADWQDRPRHLIRENSHV